MARDIREKLNDETIVALSMPGSDWPRGLLSATMIPDKWMGLVRLPDGRRRFVAAGEEPRADEGARLVLVRNQPITVPLVIGDVRATCGNLVGATAEVLVRWSAREDDLTALHDALLAQSPLTLDRLAEVVSSSGGGHGVTRTDPRQFREITARRRPHRYVVRVARGTPETLPV